jgi:hypothetical protein
MEEERKRTERRRKMEYLKRKQGDQKRERKKAYRTQHKRVTMTTRDQLAVLVASVIVHYRCQSAYLHKSCKTRCLSGGSVSRTRRETSRSSSSVLRRRYEPNGSWVADEEDLFSSEETTRSAF